MSAGPDAEQLATQAAEAVRRVIAEAEERAAEIIRDAEDRSASIRERAEAEAAQVRERAEGDARAQIEAAKRALDELGGTLAAAASAAIPRAETESQPTETEGEQPAGPHPDPGLEPEAPSEPPGAPEAPTSPPAEETPSERALAGNGDAAERLAAMKLAVEGKDQATIEAELAERFGPADRSALLEDVLSRAAR
jgi:ElaB/YqjD/DUF883 family membrane-anchored ribosome-binding protein